MKNKIAELDFQEKNKVNELVEFLYEYERLTIQKDELSKKKRSKNDIPSPNRCIAKRANGEQCTRRKKEECDFCGTHSKGTPQGLFQTTSQPKKNNENLEVFVEEIKGIVYYIDKYNNVYKTEDILGGLENPHIISKCVRGQDGKCSIPDLGI
jgi:hypothetical protein